MPGYQAAQARKEWRRTRIARPEPYPLLPERDFTAVIRGLLDGIDQAVQVDRGLEGRLMAFAAADRLTVETPFRRGPSRTRLKTIARLDLDLTDPRFGPGSASPPALRSLDETGTEQTLSRRGERVLLTGGRRDGLLGKNVHRDVKEVNKIKMKANPDDNLLAGASAACEQLATRICARCMKRADEIAEIDRYLRTRSVTCLPPAFAAPVTGAEPGEEEKARLAKLRLWRPSWPRREASLFRPCRSRAWLAPPRA